MAKTFRKFSAIKLFCEYLKGFKPHLNKMKMRKAVLSLKFIREIFLYERENLGRGFWDFFLKKP